MDRLGWMDRGNEEWMINRCIEGRMNDTQMK